MHEFLILEEKSMESEIGYLQSDDKKTPGVSWSTLNLIGPTAVSLFQHEYRGMWIHHTYVCFPPHSAPKWPLDSLLWETKEQQSLARSECLSN